MNSQNQLEAALSYASLGWRVFPCRGKKPRIKKWQQKATTDNSQIEAWWREWPNANVAVCTGVDSGVVAVDLDGQTGIDAFKPLESKNGSVPMTPRSKTGGGGEHIFFRHPGDGRLGNRTKIDGTKIDFRGDGGYVIVPPSDHNSGRNYEWLACPSEVEPAELPTWVRDFVSKKTATGRQASWLVGFNLESAAGVSEGGRHDTACRLIGAHLGRGEPMETVLNIALAWNQKNEPPLPEDEISKIVHNLNEKEQSKEKTRHAAGTQRSRLLGIAEDCQLLRAVDGETFVTFTVNSHEEFWAVKASRFRKWLLHNYRKRYGDTPQKDGVNSVIELLDAKASFDAELVTVSVRVGSDENVIYLDLCDDEWRAIRVDADGWSAVTSPPVRFRRGRGMLPLPEPVPGGSVSDLRSLLNVDDESWPLVIGWLIGAFHPRGPYPILAIVGEQGSSKSTTARLLQSLIDPSKAQLRSAPDNVQDLMVAAKHSWCLAFDNLSKLSPRLSDALCRLSTGGAFGTRQLYSDDDENLLEASRPVILTSIAEIATRSDLLDRCVVVQLSPMRREQRRTEAVLRADFERVKPAILEALLGAVVTGLRNLPSVQLEYSPRMADFATWVVACEPGLGLPAGSFLNAYIRNVQSANSIALESSPIFAVVTRLLGGGRRFEGTATELLAGLNRTATDKEKANEGWPNIPRSLADRMRELAPNLRAQGYWVEERQTPGSGSRKLWILESPDDSAAQMAEL